MLVRVTCDQLGEYLKTEVSVITEAASLAFFFHLLLVHLFMVWALCSQFSIRGLSQNKELVLRVLHVMLCFVKNYRYESTLCKHYQY